MDTSSFNLKYIVTKGKGIFSELLAKHCVQNEFAPKLLTLIESIDESDTSTDKKDNDSDLLKDQQLYEFYCK